MSTTRRNAFRCVAAAGLVSVTSVTTTTLAASLDAPLIKACDDLVSAEKDFWNFCESRTGMTLEQERATEPMVTVLLVPIHTAEKVILANLPPRSVVGASALARAAVAGIYDATGFSSDIGEVLAQNALEYLAQHAA